MNKDRTSILNELVDAEVADGLYDLRPDSDKKLSKLLSEYRAQQARREARHAALRQQIALLRAKAAREKRERP